MRPSTANSREHLIALPSVILMGMVIIFLMTLLFPKKSTFEDQRYIQNPDQLSIAYLKAIYKLRPLDIGLRLTLSKQLVSIGKWQEAREVLSGAKLLNGKDLNQAAIIYVKIYQGEYESMQEDSPARAKALMKAHDILNDIDVFLYDISSLQLLSEAALNLSKPDLASIIYKRLAELDKENKAKWWALAGKWARASSQPALAGVYYSKAYHASKNSEQSINYGKLSVVSSIEASQHALTINYLKKYLSRFPKNYYFLEIIVSVYKMQGNIKAEAKWNKKFWLHYKQGDEKVTLRQLDLELALAHLQHARKFSYKLVSIKPNNNKYRRRLAQLEEWTGHPIAAQKQWQILARESNKPDEDEQVLRLSIMNFDEDSTIAALINIAEKRPLTTNEMLERVYSYERQGKPISSQIALDKYLSMNPDDKKMWFILAGLYENQNDYEGAVKTWRRIEALFDGKAQAAMQQIELHWDYQNHEEAYLKARTIDQDFSKIKTFYHVEILSELGWRFRDGQLLRKASLEMLRRDEKNELAYERLLILADENKDVDQAVMLAEAAWRHTGNSIFLRMAIETAIDKNNRKHIEYLLGLALQRKNNVNDLVDYVLVMAELEDKNENFLSAAKYYEYAMRLDPDVKSIHIGFLWSLLNSKQKSKLKHYLVAFKSKANKFSQYWPIYAAATHEIGESRESVYWHNRIMQQYPDNDLWLLSYADALEADSRYSSALKLRLYVMKKIRANSLYTLLSKQSTNQLTKAYILLERNNGSGVNAGNMLKTIINNDQQSNKKIPYEFLVAWYISYANHDMAKYWHLRQQLSRMKASDNQMLTLALNENNLKDVENYVLKKSAISPVDRNEGLRRLGLYEQALAGSIPNIGLLSNKKEKLLYREQAASLLNILPNYWATGTDRHTNGELVITELEAQTKASLHKKVLGLSASQNTLEINPLSVNLNENNIETEVDLKIMWPGRRINYYSNVNYNQRDDKSVFAMKLGMDYLFSKRTRIELAWENNQLSEESSALRALGVNDRTQVSLNANVGSREYINLRFSKVNYASRWGDKLADGWAADFNVGHRLSTGRNEWVIQFDTNWINNQLENNLPIEVSQRLPIGSTTDLLVAEEFGTIGMSMRVNRGRIKSNYPQVGSIRYFVDAWIGQVYPAKNFATRFSAGFGTRVIGNDELSLGVYSDQTKNRVGTQNSWGINLLYRNYIGR